MRTLDPAFRDEVYERLFPGQLDWTVVAANASQISDGAAALLLASEDRARQLGLPALATIVAQTVVGDDPIFMLTGPIPATSKLCARAAEWQTSP